MAEMLLGGYTTTTLAAWFNNDNAADVYRHQHIGALGPAVVDAVRAHAGTQYAFGQIGVLTTAVQHPFNPLYVLSSAAFYSYGLMDYGSQRMICSELVERVFAETDSSLGLSVELWPTLRLLGNTSSQFRSDFTTPTVLSRSTSLRRLNV